MVIARAQARSLLTDAEMALFGDSRNPALRSLTERELTRRIDRVRKLRDKSRDLLQRQRLSSRQRTGNKGGKSGAANERTARKGEVLDDVLQRFVNRLHELESSESSGTSNKSAAATARKRGTAEGAAKAKKRPQRGATAKKTAGAAKKPAAATRKSVGAAKKAAAPGSSGAARKTAGAARKAPGAGTRKTGPQTSAATSKTAKTTAKKSPSTSKTARTTAKKSSAPAARQRRKSVTPEQALASTREQLEARQQRRNMPRQYPGDGDAGQPGPGYQSAQARAKALELHAGEVRMEPIHGSISTRDRKNQAKRDRT